jgi:hypothetical protein
VWNVGEKLFSELNKKEATPKKEIHGIPRQELDFLVIFFSFFFPKYGRKSSLETGRTQSPPLCGD